MKEKDCPVKQVYDPAILPDLLPLYYKRLFPHMPFYRWLSYGNGMKTDTNWIVTTNFFVFISGFVCFHTSRVLVHASGRHLSKISVFRKPIRIRGRIMFEESYEIRYRSCHECSVHKNLFKDNLTDHNIYKSSEFQSPRSSVCSNNDTNPT